MKYVIGTFLLLVLFACNPDKKKRASKEKLRFSTREDAELFFNNVRRTSYDLQNLEAAKLSVYRHSERNTEADYPLMTLAIAVHYLQDEAYLLIEPNEFILPGQPIVINWLDTLKDQSGTYTFEYGNKMEHLEFAGHIYNSILDGHVLQLQRPEGQIPFLNKEKDKKVFRTTVLDYYRLTGNIK